MNTKLLPIPFALALGFYQSAAWADPTEVTDIEELPATTVTATRAQMEQLQTPASVAIVSGQELQQRGGMKADLSEALQGIAGLSASNRHNYAQEVQLSSRGSRSGVRGIRLYVDGIPATMPDGQGVTTHIDLNSVGRIEVLKGPFSSLYGNSSAGAVLVQTENGSNPSVLETSVQGGSGGSWHYGIKATGGGDGQYVPAYVISANRFTTQGFRDHSAARKNLANIKLGWKAKNGADMGLVFNHSDIQAQDPGGLTREQWQQNRNQVHDNISQYNARKDVRQSQLGLSYQQNIGDNSRLHVSAYAGERRLKQYLPVPSTAQTRPGHAGGVIEFNRHYAGADVRWHYQVTPTFSTIAGISFDYMQDKRRGYENFLGRATNPSVTGVQGALRRNETNTLYNIDPYVQAQWQFAPNWMLDGGLRYSSVTFKSKDRYITATNGDDSGRKRYGKLLPTLGLSWQGLPNTSLYAAYSRSFETGTFLEMSYRHDQQPGLNFDLQPLTGHNYEIGAKTQLGDGLLTTALFHSNTRNDIVSAGTFDGRATYRNAGRTRRQGLELGWKGKVYKHLHLTAAYTLVDAQFTENAAGNIRAGSKIPGIAQHNAYAALGWHSPQGWRIGADVRHSSKVHVNNANSEAAPAYTVAGSYAGYRWQKGAWQIDANARIDNLFNRDYAGSVIVNDANGRYHEPSPKRHYSVGVNVAYRF